ncbi:hypothetical protein TNCV_1461701 [Trichonephila clavipes]|nr:hypothetical protein TNCV_1461701 [Trichonephila clavipes]
MATGSFMTPIYSRSQSEVQGDLHKCASKSPCRHIGARGQRNSSTVMRVWKQWTDNHRTTRKTGFHKQTFKICLTPCHFL